MKKAGKTILFCSHSLYQVEAFCDQVLWLDQGQTKLLGEPQDVIRQYGQFLQGARAYPEESQTNIGKVHAGISVPAADEMNSAPDGCAFFTRIEVRLDGRLGREFTGYPGENTLSILLQFKSDPSLPAPHVGVTLDYGSLLAVTCVVSRSDNITILRDAQGRGEVILEFPKLALRKGEYFVGVYLGCENALHIYDNVQAVAKLYIQDSLAEPGLVNLPHQWHTQAGLSVLAAETGAPIAKQESAAS